jgi:hypothetical protein
VAAVLAVAVQRGYAVPPRSVRRALNAGRWPILIKCKPHSGAAIDGIIAIFCLGLASRAAGAGAASRGLLLVVHTLLVQWPWGLVIPFPELALEVGHVGLVLELVQVLHRLHACSATLLARELYWPCL